MGLNKVYGHRIFYTLRQNSRYCRYDSPNFPKIRQQCTLLSPKTLPVTFVWELPCSLACTHPARWASAPQRLCHRFIFPLSINACDCGDIILTINYQFFWLVLVASSGKTVALNQSYILNKQNKCHICIYSHRRFFLKGVKHAQFWFTH